MVVSVQYIINLFINVYEILNTFKFISVQSLIIN